MKTKPWRIFFFWPPPSCAQAAAPAQFPPTSTKKRYFSAPKQGWPCFFVHPFVKKYMFKISVVSYLNARPFHYGLNMIDVDDIAELSLDIPSECARKLIDGEVDLGLVPVAVIPKIPHAQLISNYCIGCEGEVKTVCIFAERPISELEVIYLDWQSRTSVELAKILLKNHWKCSPELRAGEEGFETKIHGRVGALIIGDRAMGLHSEYPYAYDLGTAWKKMTGLPFVFAAWVANKPLPLYFTERFEAALEYGVGAIPKISLLYESPHPEFNLQEYYTRNISYHLDDRKRQALSMFLQMIKPKGKEEL